MTFNKLVFYFSILSFFLLEHIKIKCAFQGGNGLVYQLKKSYSLTDLANVDEADFDRGRAIGFADQSSESL